VEHAVTVRESNKICEQAFDFLIHDYGYYKLANEMARGGFCLRYQGHVLGVEVEWYPTYPLTVWLVRLIGNSFPPYPVSITPNTELNYFDLQDLETINGYQRQVDQDQLYSLPDEQNTSELARSLKANGADLLQGNLACLSRLEDCIRARAKAPHGR
jgi:hypothetical protein